jgi:hypothetical protein
MWAEKVELSHSEATNFMDKPNEICMSFETVAQKFYIGLGCDFFLMSHRVWKRSIYFCIWKTTTAYLN